MSVVSWEVTSTQPLLLLLLLLQTLALPACDDPRAPADRPASGAAPAPRRLPPSARRAQAEYAAGEAARLLDENDLAGAREQWQAALTLEPMNRRAQMVSGRAHHSEVRYAEALRAFERALDIHEDLAVREWMGLTYLALHDAALAEQIAGSGDESPREFAEAALEQFQCAVDLEPLSVNARHNLGYTHRLIGNYPESARILEKIVEQNPQHLLSLFELGMTLEAASRRGEARAIYERVLGIMPGHEKARVAMARLDPEGS